MIKALYCNSSSVVLINNIQGNTFKTTVGVRQGRLLSPVLFNVFLEEIMADIQNNHTSTIIIGGLSISNTRFADDIDLIAGNTQELQAALVKRSRTNYQITLANTVCKLLSKKVKY